jgi:hypothetical protein
VSEVRSFDPGQLAELLTEMKAEFPDFAIVSKRESPLQLAIGSCLALITFGGQRTYVSRYHTVMFGKLWVPDSWPQMSADARYVLLRHERVHLRQRARMGEVGMAFVYLLPFFPLGLAYGRARIEWEVYGPAALSALKRELVQRFTGPDYGWMWPFPQVIERWFDRAVDRLPDGSAR